MRSFTVLTGLLALVVYGLSPYDTNALAAKGGGHTSNTSTNITVVDSTGKLVGNVVGAPNGQIYFVALDPALTGGDSSVVITVNRNRLGGNAFVYFTTSDCTGSVYFPVQESLVPQTYIATTSAPFMLYKVNSASTPSTITGSSALFYAPDMNGTGIYCQTLGYDVTVYTADPTPITLTLTPPFSLVNP